MYDFAISADQTDRGRLLAERFEREAKNYRNTPDLWHIMERPCQLVFMYGELMTRHEKHSTFVDLTGAHLLAAGFTRDHFSMWKKRAGMNSFPVILDKGFKDSPCARIKGELYLMQSNRLIPLDIYESNGTLWQRKRIKVVIPYLRIDKWGYKHPEEETIRAWCYVGMEDPWLRSLDGGYSFAPVKRYIPNNPDKLSYYYFSTNEYNS